MIVEMLGAPGAGKTSLLPAAREFFNRRGLRAWSVVEAARPAAAGTRAGRLAARLLPEPLRGFALWQIFYACSRRCQRDFHRQYPRLVEGVLREQRRRPISGYDRRHVLRWFLHLTGVYSFLRESMDPADVLIIDEGFVHRVVQLFASENEELQPRQVIDYLDAVPRPDLVIFVSAPAGSSRRRVFERGLWPRFQRKSQVETQRFLERAQAAVEIAADHLTRAGWPLIRIDNDGQEIHSVGARLQAELAHWSAAIQPLE